MSENILHINAVRIRANGLSSLKLKLIGYDQNMGSELVPLPITPHPGKSYVRLANFMDQRAQLEIKTTEKDEVFKIQRIVIYAKPIYAEFPA